MAFQYEPPVTVFNGPDAAYAVNARQNTDDSFTQLVGIGDEWSDAFGRLRVSNPQSLFAASFTYDTQPILYEAVQTTSGTVAHNANARAATLTAAVTSGSLAALQSRQYIPYEPGKSQLIKLTAEWGDAVANIRRRCGLFDAANGFYAEQTTAGVSFVRRSTSTGTLVNTPVAQAAWNIDPLDGTGPSGVTLDLGATGGQLLVIDAAWLGVGRVRMGWNIGGRTIYCHEFNHSNTDGASAPYVQSFTLPIRWSIESTATSAGATFKAICAEVESEGGVNSPNGFTFSAANAANVTTSTARAHLLSIRPATQYPASSGLVNRSYVVPLELSVFAASEAVLVEVMYGSTLTGGTWTRANASSAVEYTTVAPTITTPGILVSSFFVAAGSGPKVAAAGATGIGDTYPLTLDIAGAAPKALTLAVTAVTGTSGTARGGIGWKEIR